jgi:hypothetical protein
MTFCSLAATSCCFAQDFENRWFVDSGSAGGNGSSWGTAFLDIQDALDEAAQSDGSDEIWVKFGTYIPSEILFGRKSYGLQDDTAIFGGFAGTESQLVERNPEGLVTAISGDIAGDDDDVMSDCCIAHATAGCEDEACEVAVSVAAASCDCNTADNSFKIVQAHNANDSSMLNGFTVHHGRYAGSMRSPVKSLRCLSIARFLGMQQWKMRRVVR